MGYSHEYSREFGDLAFYAGAFKLELQFLTPTVAVLYDKGSGTLLKHGAPKDVKKWMMQYEKDGAEKFWTLIVVEFPGNYPVAELNAMIHTSGSVLYHVERAAGGDYKPE